MNTDPHFSSKTPEWATPQDFFDELNREFKFTLDPCATKKNAKCKKFYTEKDDGLSKSWKGERVFMNPPYGRPIAGWVKKAATGGCFNNSLPSSGTHRYALVPRLHLWQGRDPFYQRQTQIRRTRKLCTVSVDGCHF